MKKSYRLILLLVATVATVGGVAFTLTRHPALVPGTGEREVILKPHAQQDTRTWQTYEDEYLAFKYPLEWRAVKHNRDVEGKLITTIELYDSEQGYPYGGGFLAPISISHQPDTYGGDIYKQITDEIARSWIQDERVLVDGQKGYLLIGEARPGIVNSWVVFAHNRAFGFDHGIGSNRGIVGEEQVVKLGQTFETILSSVHLK